MAFPPPDRHLLRARDLADARYFEPLGVDDLAARRGALARPLQPRVPPRVRRVAARLPADSPARAGRGAVAHHRPLGRRRSASRSASRASARSRPASPARYGVSPTAYRARFPPASDAARSSRRCVVRAYGRPQHSTFREDSGAARLAWSATVNSNRRRTTMIKIATRPALGPRPGRGARLLHRQARHGGPRRRHPGRDGRLPLAHRRPARPGGRRDRADGDPRPAGVRRGDRRAGPQPAGQGLRRDGLPDHRRLPAPPTRSSRPAASSSPRRPRSARTASTRAFAIRAATRSD